LLIKESKGANLIIALSAVPVRALLPINRLLLQSVRILPRTPPTCLFFYLLR